MLLNINLLEHIYFFNIGSYRQDSGSFFEWTSKNYHKSSFFEIRLTRNAPQQDIFYCLSKSDLKLVYWVTNDVVFSLGANPEKIQSPLLEVLIEYLQGIFFDTYSGSLLMTCYGDVCNIFDGFKSIVEEAFKNYNKLDLYKTTLVTCKGCNKTITLIIKKSLVEKSTKPTITLVYSHSGHAILVYIDKQYKVRGSELVSIAY